MSAKYNKLTGKHVLVIGGSSGIGLGVAEASLAAGASVTISSSSPSKLSTATETLLSLLPPSSGQKVQGFAANLSGADAEANLEAAFKQAGPVDHVVFTAADGLVLTMLQDITPEEILAACQMRLVAPLLAAKVAARHSPRSNASSIVFTSGSASHKSAPGWSMYSYFGAGLQGLVRQLAVEMKPLRVNVVAPGQVDTGLWDHMVEEDRRAMVEGAEGVVPTGRFGQVEDVVEAYLWLMKDRNVTGTVAATDDNAFPRQLVTQSPGGTVSTTGARPSAAPLEDFSRFVRVHRTGKPRLHDQFILGQVCSAARTVTARPWKSIIANLPRDERMQFFHGISHTLPFHYVCASCGGLHEAEGDDLPAAWLPRWKRDQEIYSPPFGQLPPCRERSEHGVVSYWVQGQPYYITEKHIQMAMKLHMLGKVDNAYFRGVMARSTDHGISSRCEDVELIYSVEPKIVANRFIFRSEWKLSHPEGDLSWASGEIRTYWHGFCFHLQFYGDKANPWGDMTLEELLDQYPADLAEDIREDYIIQGQSRTLDLNADRALSPEMRNQEVTGHCVHCPTDYSIRVGPDNEIILRGWYDCGTHQAPDQPRYWDCESNSGEPGSIKRMWEESE